MSCTGLGEGDEVPVCFRSVLIRSRTWSLVIWEWLSMSALLNMSTRYFCSTPVWNWFQEWSWIASSNWLRVIAKRFDLALNLKIWSNIMSNICWDYSSISWFSISMSSMISLWFSNGEESAFDSNVFPLKSKVVTLRSKVLAWRVLVGRDLPLET